MERLCHVRTSFLIIFSLIALALILSACGGSSNNGQPTASTLIVKALSLLDAPAPDVFVVLGDKNGAFLSVAKTDAAGEVHFEAPPSDATVTLILQGSGANYSMITYYDVTVPLLISRITPPPPTVTSLPTKGPLGSVTITVTNATDAPQWSVSIGKIYISNRANTFTIPVDRSDLQDDGKISFVVVGRDTMGDATSYGTLLDQEFTDGMSVNLFLDKTDFLDVTTTVSNFQGPSTNLWEMIYATHKNGTMVMFPSDRLPANSAGPVELHAKVIPGFADEIYSEVTDYPPGSISKIGRISTDLSNLTFDFAEALPGAKNVVIAGAGTDDVEVTWDNIDQAADSVVISARQIGNDQTPSYFYQIFVPPGRKSITLPQIPDSLAGFRPKWIQSVKIGSLDYDHIHGYEEFISEPPHDNWSGPYGASYRWTAMMW